MVGRLSCFVAGVALGGYVVQKLTRTDSAWGPAGIAHRVEGHVADYRAALREFNEDVREATRLRESELHRLHSGEPTPAGRALPRRAAESIESPGANGAHDMKDGRR